MRDKTRLGNNPALTHILTVVVAVVISIGSAQAANISTISSTIPANGDVNPYGVAQVPTTIGSLVAGNILVSNFNNGANLQGTGTTIVQITPSGGFSLFAQINADTLPGPCPGGVGLTTALVVLRTGWVIVGSLPTADGTAATAQAGCLIVLDSTGNVAETISNLLINGPWDMTVSDQGSTATLFVTNVLNGTVRGGGKVVHDGTVLRVVLQISGNSAPSVTSMTVIGSSFSERTDPAALVIGPTGVGLSANGSTLYVADSLNNRIAAISNPLTRTTSAKTGTTVSSGGSLNDPLGLTVGPTGKILTVNGNDGYRVETTPTGIQTSKTLLDSSGDPPGAGALFGLAVVKGQGLYYVDDATNTLNLLH
ncbi:MAG: hypothetical protein LAO03_23340 [Acidobacteriia bacterium]|nr:hypothetical protein [Terriglobia bacterium]